MDTNGILLIVLLCFVAALIALAAVLLIKLTKKESINKTDLQKMADEIKEKLEDDQRDLRTEVIESTQNSVKSLGEMISLSQKNEAEHQSRRIDESSKNTLEKIEIIRSGISHQLNQMNLSTEERLKTFSVENEKKLENIRQTISTSLSDMQKDNNDKLDKMREIVDEKLQKTLEDRLTGSFKLVNERLEQVYKGLGEMQSLASGVGDLKKVLSNVKTRGILGEIQLGAILEEILAPEQYEVNVITKKGSRDPVEYAVKLPTDKGEAIMLPIDSKFPGDTYAALMDAYDTGNKDEIEAAAAQLRARINLCAKDISSKYIDPPNTTDFAIMFLPFEGLYAEVVNRGLVEELQNKYRVNIAGPSTMAALLNSLQMGFRTFAIQKRSGEVWQVLGAVKTEFDKFSEVLVKTQERLRQADAELDKLVTTRTNQIRRKLKDVSSLSQEDTNALLPKNDYYIDEE
ncbi:MAG: DNA recombination protein RmuC [Clostridia bacterium]|nr:DNA recombination protein RmuC [Clostridia bacterium]